MIIFKCDFCDYETPSNEEMYSLSRLGPSYMMGKPDYDELMICATCLTKIKEMREDEK